MTPYKSTLIHHSTPLYNAKIDRQNKKLLNLVRNLLLASLCQTAKCLTTFHTYVVGKDFEDLNVHFIYCTKSLQR